jgi:hypothetical protein
LSRGRRSLAALLLVPMLAACGSGAPRHEAGGTRGAPAAPGSAAAAPRVVRPVAKLRSRVRPDVLVVAPKALPKRTADKLRRLAPGFASFSAGRARIGGRATGVAGVDPSRFRRFTPKGTAEADAVWQAVAAGDLVLAHDLAKTRRIELGSTVAVGGKPSMRLRVAALATAGIPGSGAIVASDIASSLGLPRDNAVILGAGRGDPSALAVRVRRVVGSRATVHQLTKPEPQVAFLTGSNAAAAFGGFTYKYFDDGTIRPDARWVAANIVGATVPVLGHVTCHRLMVPQLRAALADVQAAGLAPLIRSYDGCYVPRFIERDPSHPISLHTWGIAIDLDAARNQRGGRGAMDPRIVAIFKRWGFRWGGDWTYTDPMHFELAALMTTG